jgi:hypothetical protein
MIQPTLVSIITDTNLPRTAQPKGICESLVEVHFKQNSEGAGTISLKCIPWHQRWWIRPSH